MLFYHCVPFHDHLTTGKANKSISELYNFHFTHFFNICVRSLRFYLGSTTVYAGPSAVRIYPFVNYIFAGNLNILYCISLNVMLG